MMRRIANDGSERRFECAEHGGRFGTQEAMMHLLEVHPELVDVGNRILDANRETLPVSPLVPHVPTCPQCDGRGCAHCAPARISTQNRAARRRARRRGGRA